jgi:hypothetical protein
MHEQVAIIVAEWGELCNEINELRMKNGELVIRYGFVKFLRFIKFIIYCHCEQVLYSMFAWQSLVILRFGYSKFLPAGRQGIKIQNFLINPFKHAINWEF